MEESVRPCLRCDALVPESRAYCAECGGAMFTLRFVVPRPGAAAMHPEREQAANVFVSMLLAAGSFAMVAIGIALYASVT
jgi:hypothetical protein